MISFSNFSLFRLRNIIILAAFLIIVILFSWQRGEPVTETLDQSSSAFDNLASFEALYKVSLNQAKPGSSISGYNGLMSLSWVDECQGFRSDQQLVADLSDNDGASFLSEFASTAWEEKDQTEFHFVQTSKMNSQKIREIAGQAKRKNRGSGGEIVLKEPEDLKHPLGADVMYPTMYLADLIKAAQQGKSYHRAYLYDGSDEHFKFDVVAAIGAKSMQSDASNNIELALLADVPYWPVHASYFPAGSKEPMPEFQISMHLYENGISTNVVLDYESFILDAELVKLQIQEKPECTEIQD